MSTPPQGDGATALHWAVQLDDLNTVEFLITCRGPVERVQRHRSDAAVPGVHEPQRGDGRQASGSRRQPERGTAEGRDRSHDVRSFGKFGGGEGAPPPWRRRERSRACAQSDGFDVGGRSAPSSGRRSPARSRSECPRPIPCLSAGRYCRRDAACRAAKNSNYTVLRGGSTPLLFAARSGDVESARLLLAAGAGANEALPDGATALTVAAHSGHGALGALLLEQVPIRTPGPSAMPRCMRPYCAVTSLSSKRS